MALKIDRKKVTDAQKSIFDGELMLFNARLDALMEAGEAEAVEVLLNQGVTLRANNCGCNNGCDAAPVMYPPS